jgi:hypothetical protein
MARYICKLTRHSISQIVDYMLGNRLNYGFISTYNETVFLYLDLAKPQIVFSNVIHYSDRVDKKISMVSLRLAVLQFIHLSCSDNKNGRRMPKKTVKATKTWIKSDPEPTQDFLTPYKRDERDAILIADRTHLTSYNKSQHYHCIRATRCRICH